LARLVIRTGLLTALYKTSMAHFDFLPGSDDATRRFVFDKGSMENQANDLATSPEAAAPLAGSLQAGGRISDSAGLQQRLLRDHHLQ
jgi:hypothetical protein